MGSGGTTPTFGATYVPEMGRPSAPSAASAFTGASVSRHTYIGPATDAANRGKFTLEAPRVRAWYLRRLGLRIAARALTPRKMVPNSIPNAPLDSTLSTLSILRTQ